MEKIKNLIHPGHKKDDEVMYGSGQSDDPVHTGRGPVSSKVEGEYDTNPMGKSGHDKVRAPEARDYSQGSNTDAIGGSSSSRMPGAFDDSATTASVKSGVAGEPQTGSTMSGSNINDPLDTNKALPREPATAGSGYIAGAPDVGPHSSSLANKADPRVDSDLDGSRGLESGTTGTGGGLTGTSLPDRSVGSSGHGDHPSTGSSHLGRDAALGAGALGAGEAAHHHREKQDIGTGSGREFPLGGSSTTAEPGLAGGYGSGTGPTAGSANQGSLGSSSGVPLSGAYNEESWTHAHSKKGHQYGGDPCGPEASAPGSPHFTQGPHALDTANRLDPHVGSGIGAPTGSTNTGGSSRSGSGLGSSSTGTGMGSSSTGDRHLGRDAALAGGAGAAGVGAYESGRGTSGPTAAGPHSSNLANKADPRVDSDLSNQRGTPTGTSGLGSDTTTTGPASGVTGRASEGTALPSDNLTSGSTGRDHHHVRDAGIAGGAGAAGLGAYEAGKQHHGQDPMSTTSGSTADPYSSSGVDPRVDSSRSATSGVGPHSSGLANRAEPRVDSDLDGSRGLGSGTVGTGAETSGKDHHYGRDAGIVGAGGLAAYEGEKHLGGKHESSQTGTSSTSTGYGTPSNVLYDTGRGPTTSGMEQPSTGASSTTTGYGTPGQSTAGYDQQRPSSGHHLGRDAGLAGAGGVGAYEADKHLGKDHSRDAYSAGPTSTDQPTGHHYGRDAALGAGGVGAGTAAYEADKHHGGQEPLGTTAAYDGQQAAPSHSHTGRDTALAGGAGAGAGALAGSEFSKKDAEHQAQQDLKDQKAHDKELAKEHKAHDKALEKEQKYHQKEIEKEQKHHQKDIAAAEKKHGKELDKEESHGEKKQHGGILGLFKRDKPDDELKRENMERKGELPPSTDTSSGTTGLSSYEQHERAGDHQGMSEADKLLQARENDRNRLHKDPPPGYMEKKMEQEGYGQGGSTGSGLQTGSGGRVTEPHTGLPADLSKGTGEYGTDDTPTSGLHGH